MIPLKIVTEYSLLKSLIKINELIPFLSENKISSCAICDDNLFGSIDFYLKCKEYKIKPIIGLDIKVDNANIYLYAKNYEGYKDLLKINTKKQKHELTYEEIVSENLLYIIPYQSLDIYGKVLNKKNVYLGYETEDQRKNVKMLSTSIIYIKPARALRKNDIEYLEYLKKLGSNFDYKDSEYLDFNITLEEIVSQEHFANQIDIEIPFNNRYIPKYRENSTSLYLETLAYKGLEKRCNGFIPLEYKNRLEEELKVIKDLGFVDYFLIVYDYVLYAKKNDIFVGCRGSAAGSLVSFAIGITDIDPVKYNLLFARFLNPYRTKMPDIDIDIEDTKRQDLIEYVKMRWGEDKVAVGLTFTTYKSKLILRDLAKVLQINQDLFEKFIKTIFSDKTLSENYQNSDVKKYLEIYPALKKLYSIALHLEGLKKNTSTHAAGVVISSVPLDEVIPTFNDKDETLKTGIEMNEKLEKMGLLKMDFLALRNLTMIKNIISKIPNLNINDIPLDKKEVYELFISGKCDDIFQFESRYAKECLQKIKPSNFQELCISMALVRPGANNELDTYINNKNNGYEIDSSLKEILDETKGVMIYQEQVIKILEKVAKYSPYEADLIRASISKKKEDVILKEEDKFINNAINNGYSKEFSVDLFNKIKRFAEYGFNKSHSVAYSRLAYILAYLKTLYPIEFTISLLEQSKDIESKKRYLSYLKSKKIIILPVNINYSQNTFLYKNNNLLLPFNMIKNLNLNVINQVIENRKYNDIFELLSKCNLISDVKIYEALVYSGSLDSFKVNRKTLIENYELIKNYVSLNDLDLKKPLLKEYAEFSDAELRLKEQEYYGIYIGNHPSSIYKDVNKAISIKDNLFKNITMILLVEKITKIKTKKNEDMAFITASDETGEVELTIFPNLFSSLENLKENDIIYIKGKSSKRFDKYSIIVDYLKKKAE